MSRQIQVSRKDVFRSGLVRGAVFQGQQELPCITTSDVIPKDIISFDKAFSSRQYDRWVHFYIYDYQFERIWTRPSKYLNLLQKFQGVISPDFSLYRDMPFSEQTWNTYRNRALGYWLSANEIQVIPNVRWGDERSYSFCFDGIESGKTVAIGTHGCIKKADDRHYFKLGLDAMIQKLYPSRIIVYGRTPESLFSPYIGKIEVIQFDSEYDLSRQKEAV